MKDHSSPDLPTHEHQQGAGSAEAAPQRRGASGPRGGREAVTARILGAAEDLFAARGVSGVSVRQIAHAAGVSHALVHRYVGSKKDLVTAILVRNEYLMAEAMVSSEELPEAARAMFRRALPSLHSYLVLMLRWVLDGTPHRKTYGKFPATQRLVDLAQRRAELVDPEALRIDPRFLAASLMTLTLGWVGMTPFILKPAGLDEWSEERWQEELERLLLLMIEAALPLEKGDAAG